MNEEKDRTEREPDSWTIRQILQKDCRCAFESLLNLTGDNYLASIKLIRLHLILQSIDLNVVSTLEEIEQDD